MFNITCIIMASGLSKRMGKNKLLLQFKEKEIFKYVLDAVNLSDISQRIVVSSYDEILNYAEGLKDFKTVKNSENSLGQSKSISLGVNNSNICDGFMFLPCDMPFMTYSFINDICSFFYQDTKCITVPRIDKKNSMPTIFPYSLKADLLNISGDVGGREIIRSNPKIIRYIDIENPLLLQDIDTKEDYIRFKNI
ncbi:MAG: NTP transferase domain-containing protein [Peptoanaerobacter stomatis]|uniref:NTP transferase domain-containing protein n=1 Tax=Peptoanaerobacter stomatis TaxID=796937 RepID=UPI003F9F4E4B